VEKAGLFFALIIAGSVMNEPERIIIRSRKVHPEISLEGYQRPERERPSPPSHSHSPPPPLSRVFIKAEAPAEKLIQASASSLTASSEIRQISFAFSDLLDNEKRSDTVKNILHIKLLAPDILLGLIGLSNICHLVQLPKDVVEAALARGAATRRRLCDLVLQSLALDRDMLEQHAHDLPKTREILAEAILRFAMTGALCSHRGVLEQSSLTALKEAFGPVNLDFALKASPFLRRQNWRPSLSLVPEEIAGRAVAAFLSALHHKQPALAALFGAVLGLQPDLSDQTMQHPAASLAALAALRHALLPEDSEAASPETELDPVETASGYDKTLP
jgi:hypothetical protein